MCTVILQVPDAAGRPVRMLAVRDEDPGRPWLPLGASWPDRPGVIGVRDVRAGGAWLAASPAGRRVAVLLNRKSPPVPDGVVRVSRGTLPLRAVAGDSIHPGVAYEGFNLVEVVPGAARVIAWDGAHRQETPVPPGVHMIAHDGLDDPRTARIRAWRGAFAAAVDAADGAGWIDAWLGVLGDSARLGDDDDRAIIRDNRVHGYPTQSLLVCTAEVDASGVDVRYAVLAEPGRWNPVTPVGVEPAAGEAR